MNGSTHASFFSGVGGLDLGLERAGWRTVSFSEVDPYASAVLAQRWPGVPNLGDITAIAADERASGIRATGPCPPSRRSGRADEGVDWPDAILWTGGFPCQGLSIAGKRRGLADERSGLAFAFLDLVGRHRPPLVLLENVPGLLSSHGGQDMAALLGAMADLGYGVAYRVLDARHFGVPQRRRRVFIVGVRSGPDDPDGRAAALRAAAVLAVGTRCGRHPATGHEAGEGAAGGAGDGAIGTLREHVRPGSNIDHVIYNATAAFGAWAGPDDEAGNLSARDYKSSNHLLVDGPPPDSDRVRAPDGLAGRVDGGGGLANTVQASAGHHGHSSPRGDGTDNLVVGTLTAPDTRHRVIDGKRQDGSRLDRIPVVLGASGVTHDEPDGLDSHRYRCCGNGVVAPVAEWLGHRLMEAIA